MTIYSQEQVQRVAYHDGVGWLLQFRDKDGNYFPEEGLDWPETWPTSVDTDFLKQHGFEIAP